MDQPQLASQLEHLEQKNQEAQSTIARLQQRIEAQEYVVQEQAHKIEQLEQHLAQANSQLTHVSQIDEKLAQLKDEMLHLIERRTGRPQSAPEAGSNLVVQQLDNHTKALNELRRQVEKTQRYDEQISLARTETTRLNQEINKFKAELDKLNKQLDERIRPLDYLQEQRQTDSRKLAELEAEVPVLHKKIDDSLTKVRLIAEQLPQFAKYEAALETVREEIRSHREHMDYQLAQRERQLKDWTGLAESTERRIREIETAMEKYTEFYQLNKRALSSLQDFQERLQRDQHRFGELQRLAEERQHTELEKFQANFEERWQKQSMELQPQFVDFQKSISALQKRMEELAKLNQSIEEQLNLVLQIIEEDVYARITAVNEWQRRFEDLASGQE